MNMAVHYNGQVMLTLREHLITPPVFGVPCLFDYVSRIRQCYYGFLWARIYDFGTLTPLLLLKIEL